MTTGRLIGFILTVAGLAIIIIPTVRWFYTPELTEMQVFIQNWPIYVLGAITLTASEYMIYKFK